MKIRLCKIQRFVKMKVSVENSYYVVFFFFFFFFFVFVFVLLHMLTHPFTGVYRLPVQFIKLLYFMFYDFPLPF